MRKPSIPFLLVLLACGALLLALGSETLAQVTTARLEGLVKDPSDAVVPGVTVTAVQEGTNITYESLSNETGLYVFARLAPGNYTITAELTGFKRFQAKGIHLEVGDTKTFQVKLETGEVTETVNVSAQTAAVDTISTSVGSVVNSKQIEDLPLVTRNPMSLFYLQPGSNRFTGGGRADGLRGLASNVTVEGVSATEAALGSGALSTAAPVPIEAVGEYRVVTSSASAEYGRGAGPQVQLIYRSGTNDWHGSAFEFHRNKALNANSFAGNRQGLPKPTFIRHQFGGNLGGPIKKDKMFFHVTYEGIREKQDTTTNALVYTPTLKSGIFRYNTKGANANTLVDRQGNPLIPAGDISTINLLTVDPTRLGKDSSGLFDRLVGSFPAPNNYDVGDGFNTAGFRFLGLNPLEQKQWVVKTDYVFNTKHRLSVSYADRRYDDPGAPLLNSFGDTNFESYPAGIIAVNSALSTNLLNELRLGGTKRNANFENTDPERFKKEGLVVFAGLGGPGRGHPKNIFLPQYFPTATLTLADNATWIRGNHSFRGGVDIRLHRSNVAFGGDQYFAVIDTTRASNTPTLGTQPGLASADRTRAEQLTNDLTGSIGAIRQDYHSNAPGVFNPFESKYRHWRSHEYSYFFQDTWKARPNLTLNLGVRYELMPPHFEANGLFAYPVNGVDGLYGISGGQETRLGNVAEGGKNLYRNDKNNLAPNVGFNWDPFSDAKWSISGNYRIAYDRTWIATTLFQDFSQEGATTVQQLNASAGTRLSQLPSLFNSTTGYFNPGLPFGPKPFNRTGIVTVWDPDLYTPYTNSWSFRVQRELFRQTVVSVAYVGNKATGQMRALDLNQIQIETNGFLTGFQAAQRNLAANNNPLVGEDTGVFGRIYSVMSASDQSGQRSNISNGSVGAMADFIDRSRATSNYLGRAGLPLNFFRLNPQFQNAWLLGNNSYSSWHGMKVEVTRRFQDGLQFDVNYTFGKGLTDYEGGQTQRQAYRDNKNRALDKGITSIDATHVINGNLLWEVPVGHGRRWLGGSNAFLDAFLGGWQLNGILNYATGEPFTISSGRAHFTTASSTANCHGCAPDLTSKVIKGDTIRALTPDEVKLFTDPLAGSPGGTALRYFRGSNQVLVDSSVFKSFPLRFIPGEQRELQFRFEFFNTFNHTNFGNPQTNITSGNFGVINPPGSGQRIIQVALKFLF